MKPFSRSTGWLTALALALTGSALGQVPTPESIVGDRPGTDFKLVGWSKVVEYFGKVDAASDRVVVRELGRTTEDRPYLAAIVSAPETIARLDDYRAAQRRLALPGPDRDGPVPVRPKTVVLITCSIHSTETASTLMALELLHGLATGDDPATREILDNAILILVPSANPDGVDKVAEWYDRSRGKPWEGEGMPTLYHKYAGHDTNRDWFMTNLAETRLLTKLLYEDWFPTLTYDVHQMGSKGARMFVPPFFDPINPNLDPKMSQGIFLIGAHMAADLASAGKPGVLTNAMYDNWWNGGMRTTPQRHNMVAVLTEAASVKMASPIFVDKADLRGFTRGFSSHDPAVNFVDPWAGGWWRLRDIVDYELICARSILTLGARYRAQFQENQKRMGLEAIEKGRSEPPYGWVVPATQRDLGSAVRMLNILKDSGIEIRKARAPFEALGVRYAAGSWLLPADQPFRAHLKDLMERQRYPNRFGPNGQAETPYDVAGWTLPLQMGVQTVTLSTPYAGDFVVVDRVEPVVGQAETGGPGDLLAIRNEANDDFRVLNALLAAGVEVGRLTEPAGKNSASFPTGTLVFPAGEATRKVLDRVLPGCSTQVRLLPDTGLKQVAINRPRIAVYQPWVPSMDEGWTRLVLEQFGFAYATINDAEIKGGNLRDRFDSILIPSISARTIREGYRADQTEPAYVGGLGDEGASSLRAFVKAGGNLVCLENSSSYAIEEFRLPVKNVLKDLKTADFYAPGSILAVESSMKGSKATSPLMVGVSQDLTVYFDKSLAFEVDKSGTYNEARKYPANVLDFEETGPLVSGWLLGPEKIEGKAALVNLGYGEGQIVLFGFPPQHRGQTHSTFRLLFNSLLYFR